MPFSRAAALGYPEGMNFVPASESPCDPQNPWSRTALALPDMAAVGASGRDGELLALAGRLAARAAGEIMRIRSRGFTTETKADDSPVTEADRAAETLIVDGLRARFPQIAVIAEEEAAAGISIIPGDEYWLVDPLDGTREFAAGRDTFTVNIGLVRDGRVVLGAVALPAFGQLYTGGTMAPARRFDATGMHPISVRAAPEAGLTILASRHYADDPALAAFIATRPVAERRNFGSAAKFIRLAEGEADLYPRLGPTMEWDTAAPQAIVEAAGGRVQTFDGDVLAYGKPEWRNPPFLCLGA